MPTNNPETKQPRNKQVIAIEDMPEGFLAALRQPVEDPELAALDYLLDD